MQEEEIKQTITEKDIAEMEAQDRAEEEEIKAVQNSLKQFSVEIDEVCKKHSMILMGVGYSEAASMPFCIDSGISTNFQTSAMKNYIKEAY